MNGDEEFRRQAEELGRALWPDPGPLLRSVLQRADAAPASRRRGLAAVTTAVVAAAALVLALISRPAAPLPVARATPRAASSATAGQPSALPTVDLPRGVGAAGGGPGGLVSFPAFSGGPASTPAAALTDTYDNSDDGSTVAPSVGDTFSVSLAPQDGSPWTIAPLPAGQHELAEISTSTLTDGTVVAGYRVTGPGDLVISATHPCIGQPTCPSGRWTLEVQVGG